MAVRDRNLFAWQAYVITMSFVSVGLLLLSFFLWRFWSDLEKTHTALKADMQAKEQDFQLNSARVDRLRAMLGEGEFSQSDLEQMKERFAQDELLGNIEKQFEEKMNLFAPNDATSRNLIALPDSLLDTIRIRNQQLDEARQRENDLQRQTNETIQSETKARQDAVTAQKKAETDLEAARQQHAAAIAKLNSEKQEAYNRFDAYQTDMDRKFAQLTALKNSLEEKVRVQEQTIAEQTAVIQQYVNPDFAAPQGEVTNVRSGGTLVWINLGSRDDLRIGVPFSVIDESEINTSEATPKATIRVTQIVNESMSVARVEDYDPRKTIVPGDKVYSPAWRPGRPVGFALLGMMDVDDDSRDDLEQVKTLIQQAGGKLDALVNSKGSRDDSLPGMSPNTSFLVVGTDVDMSGATELRPDQSQRAAAYTKFRSEARSNGLIEISLDKLMGYLKSDSSTRTIPLGDRIRGGDFPIERSTRPPVSNGTVSEVFERRSPR